MLDQDKTKIILGTANFDLKYGTLKKIGKIQFAEIEKILETLESNNMLYLDTAKAYKNSESILGKIGVSNFKITTKVTLSDDVNILNSTFDSLEKLKISYLDTLLIHNPSFININNKNAIYDQFLSLKKSGHVRKIGFSDYDLSSVHSIIDEFQCDVCQLPINVLDNQFLDKGLIKKFSARGMALQARSIFLQGALLMDRYEFLDFFNGKYIKIHEEFNYFLQKNNLDALSFCLSWAIRNPQISQIVLGVNSNHQLKELINTDMLQVNKLPSIETEDIQSFLDPRQWNSF